MKIKQLFFRKTNSLIKKSRWYNNELFAGCKKFWNLKDFDLDVVNLGSTNSYYGFDYSDVNLKCANLALAPQFLLGDYEVLRNYCSYIREGGTVILCNCLFSIFDGYDITYFDHRHYSILYPASIWNFSIQRLKEVKKMQNNPLAYFPLIGVIRQFKFTGKKNNTSVRQFENNAQHWLDIWAKEFSINDFEDNLSLRNTDLKNQAIEIVQKIDAFCKSRNLRFVIVQPPVSPILRKKISKKMFALYIEGFVKSPELNNIQFINYLDDMDFDDLSLYRDAYILNKAGATKFTHKVLSDLGLYRI